jgi:putative spermidine/putrescine transport system ATP-binding protein
MVLLGPSGCGKTTLLRMIAGLEYPDSGRIFIGDREVTDLPPRKRGIAMVFQSYAVFPHLSVFDNIAFGLRMQKRPNEEVRRRVQNAAGMIQLEPYLQRYPAQLSGGQRQRVALARAVVNEPEVLLLDEPLGALDLKLRQEMQLELKRIQKHVGITFIYVTHDQEEALTMSDRVAVMANGRIEQIGPPLELYERPSTEFVAGFIGISNLLTRDGIKFVVRPEKLHILLEEDSPEPGMTVEPGVVEQVIYVGQSTRFNVRLDQGEPLVAVRQNTEAADEALQIGGRRIRLAWAPEHTYVLDQQQEPDAKPASVENTKER